MNADLLLSHFNRISDAPDAVPRLRKFILDLAVRGKLVEQDPLDEPASKIIGNATAVVPSADVSAPFSIPANWLWVRLGAICSKTGSGSTPRGGKAVYQGSGVPFLRSQNVYNDGLRLDDVAYISKQTHEKMSGTAVAPGDLLLNITGGSIGRCCLIPSDFSGANVSQHVAIIRVAIPGISHYLHQLVLSPYFQSFVISEQTGAGRGGLPKNRMDKIPVALPPLAEQKRIVVKIGELMALCDRLEEAQSNRERRRDLFTSATHHHLISGVDAQNLHEFAEFFVRHLPNLTTRPHQIKQLRQTILHMAIRGQLVPHDSKDESVRELLKRIKVEKERLFKKGEIKKEKISKSFTNGSKQFEIPPSWEWVLLGDVAFSFKYGTSVKCSYEPEGEPVLRIPNIRGGQIDLQDMKYGPLSEREVNDLSLRLGDLLMVRSNGSLDLVGRAAIVDTAAVGYCYAGYLVRVRTDVELVDTRYLLLALTARHVRDQIEIPIRSAVGLKNVNTSELSSLTFPIAPLAEQHRIVARVDELITICDSLESQINEVQAKASSLLESVLFDSLANTESVGSGHQAIRAYEISNSSKNDNF